MAEPKHEELRIHTKRAVLVAVADSRDSNPRENILEEIRGLTETAGAEVVGEILQFRRRPDPATMIGKGKVEELKLLTEAQGIYEGDFYSYRYFAAEGFLPGYNFPRLPLSAYVPGRGGHKGRDEFVSRPRFLAISEFGPRAPRVPRPRSPRHAS